MSWQQGNPGNSQLINLPRQRPRHEMENVEKKLARENKEDFIVTAASILFLLLLLLLL